MSQSIGILTFSEVENCMATYFGVLVPTLCFHEPYKQRRVSKGIFAFEKSWGGGNTDANNMSCYTLSAS